MATHTITKASHRGIGYSVVELNDVRHVFAAGVPRRGSTLRQQADDALCTIEAVIQEEGTRGSIVHQAVFVPDVGLIDECRQIIRDFYGSELPATSYIPQPPCDGKLLAIEALGVGRGLGEVQIERISEQLVITRHNDIAWVHCAQVVPQGRGAGVYEDAIDAFEQIRSLFSSVNVRFDQVIRTWLYLGGIVADEGPTQRYKELNRARTDFYRDIRFLADRLPPGHAERVYPASTGIGMRGRKLALSCLALETRRSDVHLRALENPRQIPAYAYDARYSPQSPKFSRAVALRVGDHVTTWISGTASIVNSETRHPDGVEHQTEQTIDNIERLIAADNFARHGLAGAGARLRDLAGIRVYLKRPADWKRCRAICERRFGPVPALYVVADICRPELRVEIEGVAFSRLGAPPAPREVA